MKAVVWVFGWDFWVFRRRGPGPRRRLGVLEKKRLRWHFCMYSRLTPTIECFVMINIHQAGGTVTTLLLYAIIISVWWSCDKTSILFQTLTIPVGELAHRVVCALVNYACTASDATVTRHKDSFLSQCIAIEKKTNEPKQLSIVANGDLFWWLHGCNECLMLQYTMWGGCLEHRQLSSTKKQWGVQIVEIITLTPIWRCFGSVRSQ